jgi:hypothetical protein
MLRNLVEPLRDTSKPIYWITDRVESALEMDNGFLASKELIADFKKDLSETAWNRRKNCLQIHHSFPANELTF